MSTFPQVTTASYGKTKAGEDVTEYTITNGNNVEVKIISFGAIITGIRTPDATGKVDDVTLGYNKLEDWEENPTYFGCAVGQYCISPRRLLTLALYLSLSLSLLNFFISLPIGDPILAFPKLEKAKN